MRDSLGWNEAKSTELQALAHREQLPLHEINFDMIDDSSVEQAIVIVIDQAGHLDALGDRTDPPNCFRC
jgi:hypothetical protein